MTKRFLFVILLLLIASTAALAQSAALSNDLANSFSDVAVATIDRLDAARRAKSGQPIGFRAGNSRVSLVVAPRELRTARYFAEETTTVGTRRLEKSPVTTFKGRVAGEADSSVRLTINEETLEGFFKTNGERYFIEPARRYSAFAAENEFVIYRPENIFRDASFVCPDDLGDRIEDGKKLVFDRLSGAVSGLRVLEIATEADYDFVQTTNNSATAANDKVLSILNMVEGLYESELSTSLSVVFQHAYTSADSLNGTNSSTLLNSFIADWSTRYPRGQFPRDTAHLFTYKPNVRAQGFAFYSTVCANQDFAFGLSGRVDPSWGWEQANSMVTGHEISHNLGAQHSDGVSGCANTLMNAQLTGSTQFTFCQTSRTEMETYIGQNGECMVPQTGGWYDFDGDGKTDVSIYRPDLGEWWINRSATSQTVAARFGNSTDRIVPGDFTGDGKSDIAIFRPSNGFWYVLRSEDSSFFSFPFGTNGDVAVPADFDADGKTDPAVFRPSSGTWFISRSGDGGTTIGNFGVPGDVPVTADYDGDAKSDIAIYRPSVGEWWIQRSSGGTLAFQFGQSADRPVAGDYTGDGKSDVAIFRPSNGFWYILRSEDNSFFSFPFGSTGDVPSPGDYDADGKFDPAVFRPSQGTWYVSRTTGGTSIVTFGTNGDQPVPAAFVR
jgi:hypothetical protein